MGRSMKKKVESVQKPRKQRKRNRAYRGEPGTARLKRAMAERNNTIDELPPEYIPPKPKTKMGSIKSKLKGIFK